MAFQGLREVRGAVQDILEAMPGPNGDGIGLVFTFAPLAFNLPAMYQLFNVANPEQTIWLVLWGRGNGVWPGMPGAEHQRNHTIIVRGFRQRVVALADYDEWHDLVEDVWGELAKPENVRLLLAAGEGNRCGPWDAPVRTDAQEGEQVMYFAELGAPYENEPDT